MEKLYCEWFNKFKLKDIDLGNYTVKKHRFFTNILVILLLILPFISQIFRYLGFYSTSRKLKSRSHVIFFNNAFFLTIRYRRFHDLFIIRKKVTMNKY